MSGQFSISQLQDEVSIYDEYVEFPIQTQGKEFTVKLFPFFKPEKVRDLVIDLQNFFRAAEKEKLVIPPIEEDDLVGYFIVRYFTDMKFTKSKKAKAIYSEFKLTLNSQLFKVLMKAYPQESVQSVYERIFEIIEVDNQLRNKFKDAQNVMKELPLENKEVIDQLNITQ